MRRRGRGEGGARRPWAPRPELRARASSGVLLAGKAAPAPAAHAVPTPGCCAPVAGGLLKPRPAEAPAER